MAFDRGNSAIVKKIAKTQAKRTRRTIMTTDDNGNDCGIFMATVSTTAVMKIIYNTSSP